jgi:hypothetical protein
VYAPTYRTPGLTLDGVVLHLTPTRTLALIRFDDRVQNYIRIEDLIEA